MRISQLFSNDSNKIIALNYTEKYCQLIDIIVHYMINAINDDLLLIAFSLIKKKRDPILQLIRYALINKDIFRISYNAIKKGIPLHQAATINLTWHLTQNISCNDFYETTHDRCELKQNNLILMHKKYHFFKENNNH